MRFILLVVLLLVGSSSSFRSPAFRSYKLRTKISMGLESPLHADRYLASNRFHVREGAMKTFEKRWVDRKSALETIPGFRFFTLLKRVSLFGVKYDSEFGNYVSFTYWDSKPDYQAWRNSDAFKATHGGGGIFDFIRMLTSSIFVVQGPPKPVFYDALLFKACNDSDLLHAKYNSDKPVEYDDATQLLNPSVFVAQNRFTVISGQELAFEEHWANRPSYLDQVPGFLAFSLLRREGKPDDGFSYLSSTIWENQDAFVAWSNSDQFKAAHASAHHSTTNRPTMYQQSPKLAFFEGKLSLCGNRGV
jgi:heme-degrading monooxygenase HmoA